VDDAIVIWKQSIGSSNTAVVEASSVQGDGGDLGSVMAIGLVL
jgi:hypothetical protein